MLVVLIATIFSPVIVAILRKTAPQSGIWSHYQSPMCLWGPDEPNFETPKKWTNSGQPASNPADSQDASFWHAFDLLIVIKVTLDVIFVYSRQFFTDLYDTKGNPANDPNAVTLSGGASFNAKAAITIKGTNFSALSGEVIITMSSGNINKLYGGDLQIETPLNQDTVLKLNANGTLSGGTVRDNPNVTLKGTIVVTSNDQALGQSLNFGGGGGVTGTLNLDDGTGEGSTKHVKITTGSNTITIPEGAYTKTATTLKIGNPDALSTPRNPDNATGDAKEAKLANETSFTKYWQLLPPNNI
ncbi:uncharacterized protein TA04795 [Theileria annulata]|uniref:Uncharacterized protein n=1 Tax=Theileria annulata TaxID=5874 RepID=Q4UBU9_THEAN|nr:uncharacterized protein TA04795 [Theileria annulata]CAI75702.1 hypothetical protein TA04795 [Theileria annulata]|eukprot:XP_955178.1 hypothetical protein TA04795 [Theileria annulata]